MHSSPVNSGDEPSVPRLDGGLLGAELDADPAGYYRIARILPGENWMASLRSPLTEAGVDVIKHMDQSKTADFELDTGNYTLVNANLLFDLAPQWGDVKLFLRGTNLLDERGRRHESYLKDFAPIPGISAHAGIRVGFGMGD